MPTNPDQYPVPPMDDWEDDELTRDFGRKLIQRRALCSLVKSLALLHDANLPDWATDQLRDFIRACYRGIGPNDTYFQPRSEENV